MAKKYEVRLERLVEVIVDVEADDENEATEIAIYEQSQGVLQLEDTVHSTIIGVKEIE